MRTVWHTARAVAFTSTALFALSAHAFAETASDEVAALREQISLLDQKFRVLERTQELEEEESAAAAKPTPTVAIGASGISRLSCQAAVLNGARDNESTVADAEDEKDVVVHLCVHPFRNDKDVALDGLG
jgi:hypothetical protein